MVEKGGRLYQFMVIKYLSGLEDIDFIFHGKQLKKIYPVKHIMEDFIAHGKKLSDVQDNVVIEEQGEDKGVVFSGR